MGPFNGNSMLVNAVRNAEDRTGKGMIIIDTPIINVDNSPEARAEAEKLLQQAKSWIYFCLPHHSSVEELVNKNKKIMTDCRIIWP